jgi:hypothetical protein
VTGDDAHVDGAGDDFTLQEQSVANDERPAWFDVDDGSFIG